MSMYIHLKYLSTSHHEHIGVVHVVVLNYNTTQIDGYFVLSNKPYEGIVLLIKGFLLVPSMMEFRVRCSLKFGTFVREHFANMNMN